ncbi:MAG: 2-C-methyl-D-erythritol 2,4-cyclodiphosphate synthase [Phycisphaerae bacterium]|nr:2-C-methyl-D-erythritol 2,4-cyclodiphosphate synthase [Phycisphaerae bacterium]
MAEQWRVGIGYDIHRLVDGRPLILGGIEIDFPRGLLGHSDGDVLLHAVADALLGAAGLPDIGEMFPDTDPAYKDADSRELLADVVRKVAAAGYQANNLDCIVHAEQPKLSKHKGRMVRAIADIVGLEPAAVNVKAKTNEKLGPVGAAQAISCTVAASLSPLTNKPS